MVVLDVLGYDLELQSDGGPTLVPTTAAARLEVRFSFQHVNEHAEPEHDGTATSATTTGAGAGREQLTPGLLRRAGRADPLQHLRGAGRDVTAAAARRAPGHSSTRRDPLRADPPRSVRHRGQRAPQGCRARAHRGRARHHDDADEDRPAAVARPAKVGDVLASATAVRIARNALVTEAPSTSVGSALSVAGLSPLSPAPRPVVRARVRQQPRAPRADETAIEAPHRLIISPSALEGFAHATEPQAAPSDPAAASSCGTAGWASARSTRTTSPSIDERADRQRIVRAVWTRDLDDPPPDVVTFLSSLDQSDREALVRQSADPRIATPQPVDADRLYLSRHSAHTWTCTASGTRAVRRRRASPRGWRGTTRRRWDATSSCASSSPTTSSALGHQHCAGQDHRAQDQGVGRPAGAALSAAVLRDGQPDTCLPRPADAVPADHAAAARSHPTSTSRPTRPGPPIVAGSIGALRRGPVLADGRWREVPLRLLDCLDWDGRRRTFHVPLLAVAAHLGTPAAQDRHRQRLHRPTRRRRSPRRARRSPTRRAPSPARPRWRASRCGSPASRATPVIAPRRRAWSTPTSSFRRCATSPPTPDRSTVAYAKPYLDNGFAGPNTDTQVFLTLPTPGQIVVQPGHPELGRLRPARPAGPRAVPRARARRPRRRRPGGGRARPEVRPGQVPQGRARRLPKLFGLFELTDILAAVGLGGAPKFITESLDQIAGLLADLDQLRQRGRRRHRPARPTRPRTPRRPRCRHRPSAAKARLDTVAATIGSAGRRAGHRGRRADGAGHRQRPRRRSPPPSPRR